MSQNVIDVEAIVERIKFAYKLKSNSAVARKLGLEARSDPMSKAIKRNSINLQRVVEACSDLNQDWLIWGRGTMYPNQPEFERHLYPSSLESTEALLKSVRISIGNREYVPLMPLSPGQPSNRKDEEKGEDEGQVMKGGGDQDLGGARLPAIYTVEDGRLGGLDIHGSPNKDLSSEEFPE